MKNKGFTLTELIAIIVILAIISLISTPIITNLIDDSRIKAFENTAQGIIRTVDYGYTQDLIKASTYETKFTYKNGVEETNVIAKELKYTGDKPENGIIKVNIDGEIALAIHNGRLCANKRYSDVKVSVSEIPLEECLTLNEDITTSIIVVANSNSLNVAYADYVVPANSLESQVILNQAIEEAI